MGTLITCQVHKKKPTLLLLNALHVASTGAEVQIISPDTDVLLLALRRYPQLGHNPSFITVVGDKRRTIFLKPMYDSIGDCLAAALPGFHAFTGCDTTGHFAGKGKQGCWKALKKSSVNVIEAFIQLGSNRTISPEMELALELFVCQLYLPGTELCELSSLRWHMFKKSFAESEKLPPTKGALEQHIKRAHYQATVWYHDEIAKPKLPEPSEYGWTLENNLYRPVITHLPPAPKAVLELVMCKCAERHVVPASEQIVYAQRCALVRHLMTSVRTLNNQQPLIQMTVMMNYN
uniref:Uncharacterized protein n=1 Tax=Eptatretus burgeri TaxID=7764 RepID=A0A8C4PX78_EPTBU